MIECYEDNEILDEIGNARTVKGAIRKLASTIKAKLEHRRDIEGTAW